MMFVDSKTTQIRCAEVETETGMKCKKNKNLVIYNAENYRRLLGYVNFTY